MSTHASTSRSFRPSAGFALGALACACALTACGGGDATAPGGSTTTTTTTDTTVPTVGITDNVSAATASGQITYTFTFSEDIGSSFSASDVVVTGGTAGTFTLVSPTSATLVVTPTVNSTGTVQVSLAAGAFSDVAGNASTTAASASQAYDTRPAVASGSTGTCSSPCIDFSATTVGYEAFEGLVSAAQADDPVDASNKVAKFVKGPTGQPWAGATLYTSDVTSKTVGAIDLSVNKQITLRVFATAAGQTVRLKLEDASNPNVYLEVDTPTTQASAWETLTFNFAQPLNGVYSAANTYNRVSVFSQFSTSAAPAADTITYFDELKLTLSSTPATAGTGTLTDGVFANDYTGDLGSTLTSTQGGDAGMFVDARLPNSYNWSGVAGSSVNPGGVPNFYFGFGLDSNSFSDAYMGAYVKAPANGTVNLASYANVHVNVWGPDELFKAGTFPTLQVVLQGPAVAGCGSNSGGSEVQANLVTTTQGAASVYALPLSGFSVKHACSGETTVSQVLAKINQLNVVLQGSALQYTKRDADGTAFPNGLNIGAITFN